MRRRCSTSASRPAWSTRRPRRGSSCSASASPPLKNASPCLPPPADSLLSRSASCNGRCSAWCASCPPRAQVRPAGGRLAVGRGVQCAAQALRVRDRDDGHQARARGHHQRGQAGGARPQRHAAADAGAGERGAGRRAGVDEEALPAAPPRHRRHARALRHAARGAPLCPLPAECRQRTETDAAGLVRSRTRWIRSRTSAWALWRPTCGRGSSPCLPL